MHFTKLLNSDYLCAGDFVDAQLNPIKVTLTIKSVSRKKPPAGGKEKPCFEFMETPRLAFIANGEVKKMMNMLRCADSDGWIGAKLVITSGDKQMKGQPTTGMVVVNATK